jgi:hypothetical protein
MDKYYDYMNGDFTLISLNKALETAIEKFYYHFLSVSGTEPNDI